MDIGKNIKKRRCELKISAKELSDRVYVTPAMISMIESGKKVPSINLLVGISKVLDCTIDSLVQ